MAYKYKELEVSCPICGLSKILNVPEAVLSQRKFGTIKIQVPMGAVCSDHQFIVFVDQKGVIRGYEKIDIQMAIRTVETEAEKRGLLTLRRLIQIIGFYGAFSLLHAKIFKYPSYIIIDKNFQYSVELLNSLGDQLLPENYKGNNTIKLLEETDYSKIKLKEKNALLLDTHQHILQTPWDEKLKFEEAMVKRALEIIDEQEQFILMQQNISRFIKEVEYCKDILQNVKEIYEDDLMERLSKDLMIPKINHFRLILIKNFIKQRFDPKLASKIKNKVEEFLDLL